MHNYVRPHEALAMKTPASVWHPSAAVAMMRTHRYGSIPKVPRCSGLGANGQITLRSTQLADRRPVGRRASATGASGATRVGVLLPHPHPRTRPYSPPFHSTRTAEERNDLRTLNLKAPPGKEKTAVQPPWKTLRVSHFPCPRLRRGSDFKLKSVKDAAPAFSDCRNETRSNRSTAHGPRWKRGR